MLTKTLKSLYKSRTESFAILIAFCLFSTNSHADIYDDAVITAKNSPVVEEKAIEEPIKPTYEETLAYIQKNIKYPFIETAHCSFEYKDNEGSLLTISSFNAGDLFANPDKISLECHRMSKCISQDYWGATNGSLYKQKMSWAGINLLEYNELNSKKFDEAFNHLIVLCGGSREY